MTHPNPLDPDEQNAYDILVAMLRDWNLDSLAPEVLRLLQDGYTQQQIPILLQETEPYKRRFIGNQQRKAKGLAVLSPAEYLAVERSYRQIMRQAALPEGYYDDISDYAGWIGNDVSPVELQRRVDQAADAVYRMDENTKASFNELFGLNQEDLTAYILDPDRGLDALNRVVHGGRLAGASRAYGVNLTREQAERFGEMASTVPDYLKAARDFGQLAGVGTRLGERYGMDYDAETAAEELFAGSAEAERVRRQLQSREQGQFTSGGTAAGPRALGTSPEGGSY